MLNKQQALDNDIAMSNNVDGNPKTIVISFINISHKLLRNPLPFSWINLVFNFKEIIKE